MSINTRGFESIKDILEKMDSRDDLLAGTVGQKIIKMDWSLRFILMNKI